MTDGFFGAAAAAKDVHQPVLATRRNTTLLEPQPPPPQTAQAYRALLFRGVGGALAAGAAIAVLVSAALHTGLWLCSGSWTQLGASWLAVELCFYVYYQAHCAELDAQPVPHAPTHQDPVLHFKRIYAHAKFLREVCHTPINWRHYLSTWFCGAPVSQIKLGNLREMVAYGFYYATPSQLQAEGRWHEVCSMVDQLTLIAAPEPHPTPTLTVPTPPSTMYRTPPPGAAGTSTFPDYQGQTQSQSHRNHHHPAYLHPPLSTDPALSYSSSSSSSSSSSTITTTTTSSSSGGGSSPGDVEQVMAAAVRQRALDPAEEGSVVLREGYTPGLRFMAHLWEPLRCSHRPLLLYLAIEALHCLTWGFLAACGFQRHRHLSTTFYFRNTTTAHDLRPGGQRGGGGVAPQPPTSPLLLLHGVGLGLLPYLLLICQLAAAGGAILAPEVGHVSLRLCRTVPTACQVAAKVAAMMDRLRMPPACVVAHSYGTFVASRLVQAHGARAVRSLALIDPVCFGMFLPSLLYSFVYRTPWSAFKAKGLWAAFKASFIHLVARDVHAAATFCRRFYWTDVNLWAEELPARCLVVLAGKDELLHAEEVRQVMSGGYPGVARGAQPMRLPPPLPSPCGMPAPAGATPCTHAPASSPACSSGAHLALAQSSQAAKRGAQARVLWHPTASHAGFLFNPAWQGEVVEQVLVLAREEAVQAYVTRRKTTAQGQAPLPALPSPPRHLEPHWQPLHPSVPTPYTHPLTPHPTQAHPLPPHPTQFQPAARSPSVPKAGAAEQAAVPASPHLPLPRAGPSPAPSCLPPAPPSTPPRGQSSLSAALQHTAPGVQRTRTTVWQLGQGRCSKGAQTQGLGGGDWVHVSVAVPGGVEAVGPQGGQGTTRLDSPPHCPAGATGGPGRQGVEVGRVARRHTVREGSNHMLLGLMGRWEREGGQGAEGPGGSRGQQEQQVGQVSGGGHGGGVKGEVGPRAHDVVSGEGRSRGGLDGKGDVAQQQQWAGSGSGKGVTGALSKPLASFVSVPCPGRQWEEAVAACGSAGGGSSKQLHQVVAALRGMIDSANNAHAAQ